jgi:hypothetical protein
MIARKADEPITIERIEQALRDVAYIIAEYGEVQCVPLMERLERELKLYKEARDPVSRARAILKEHADRSKEITSHD